MAGQPAIDDQLGADHGINYARQPEWGRIARGLTEAGVDCVVEVGGQRTLEQSIIALRNGGRIGFVGYGEEADTTVLELTQFRGVTAYEHGKAFGHLAIGVSDLDDACAALRAKGAKMAFAEDPDGYAIEPVQRLT